MPTPEQVTQAKRIANKACKDAKVQAADPEKNRSTRTRTAYKTKADALDRIQKILSA